MTIERELKGARKEEAVELFLYTKDGRVNELGNEGEWVDVTRLR